MKTDKQYFEEAYDLLKNKGWCQGAYARDPIGQATDWRHRDAVCFCIYGALNAVIGPEPVGKLPQLSHKLEKIVKDYKGHLHGDDQLVIWNDDPVRTREDVLHLLRDAIAAEPVS